MNNINAIKIIENERKCVYRANICDRHCNTCDLVMKDTDIIEAYDRAIYILKNNNKYRKVAKRFKRKYLFLIFAIKSAMKEISDNIDDSYANYHFNTRNGLVLAYNILKKNLAKENPKL